MLPYKTLLAISRNSEMPIYLQISKGLIEQISNGLLLPGSKLPSSRELSNLLEVHRKTIVAAYHELEAQGWIDTRKTAGTYVNEDLPLHKPVLLDHSASGFASPSLRKSVVRPGECKYQFDDGSPDIRLAPLQALGREYSSLLKNNHFIKSLNYSEELKGDPKLRDSLSKYLHDTRGIQVHRENILVTRGSVMAFYLYLSHLLNPDDLVAVGKPGYWAFNRIVGLQKGQVLSIKVDEHGLDVMRLEEHLKKSRVRLVYVISHHHHPTTVTLSPERRIKLLQLAEQHDFMILEDDYDYDFHYNSSPVLPLASLNHGGRVVYVGSFSKTIAPGLRLGFLVGTEALIEQLSQIRRFIDRMGDFTIERAISHLLDNGEIRRHLRKSLQTYRKRRDFLCSKLSTELSDYVSFSVPEGGMAIWAKFAAGIDLDDLTIRVAKKGLHIPGTSSYATSQKNCTRLGFACMNEKEIEKGFEILKAEVMNNPF